MIRNVALLLPLLVAGACASTVANRDPSGEVFPSVAGESLDGEEVRLPEALAGRRAILLVGYVMDAQFDLDRWLLGLAQGQVPAPVLEVPTIRGLLPGLFAGAIDSGMRSGIPREDWPSVVTVYGDAGKIVERTGNQTPRNGRVFVLDETGRILWFHDRGYSARLITEIDRIVRGGR